MLFFLGEAAKEIKNKCFLQSTEETCFSLLSHVRKDQLKSQIIVKSY